MSNDLSDHPVGAILGGLYLLGGIVGVTLVAGHAIVALAGLIAAYLAVHGTCVASAVVAGIVTTAVKNGDWKEEVVAKVGSKAAQELIIDLMKKGGFK